MWRAKKEFQYILDKTYKDLQEVQESLTEPYQYFDTINKVYKNQGKPNKKVEACLADMACAVSVINEYTELMKGIDDEYKTEVLDKMEAMEQERIRMEQEKLHLEEKIKLLEQENSRLKAEVEKKDQSLLAISDKYASLVNDTIAKFNDNMESFNNRVDGAVKQIACKEYMQSDDFKKKDRKGVNGSRYRQDVNNDDIISKYKSGTSIKELAEQYHMTENGMRLRLKELGVWEDRRYKR